MFEDDINKHLTENIEYEFNDQQKQVFDTIKKHIGIEEIKKENKKDEKDNNDQFNDKISQYKYELCEIFISFVSIPSMKFIPSEYIPYPVSLPDATSKSAAEKR